MSDISSNMKYYKKYFDKRVNQMSLVALFIFFIGTLADLIVSFKMYEPWVHYFTYVTLVFCMVLIILVLTKIVDTQSAAILFGYIFTLNIYIPAFIADAAYKAFVITSFTNLGVCFALIVLVYLTGRYHHGVILGVSNIVIITALYFFGLPVTQFDVAPILMFAAVTYFAYTVVNIVNSVLKENEEHKQSISDYQKKISDIRWREEQKRVSFLAMLHEEHKSFIKNIINRLNFTLKENNEVVKNNLIKEQIEYCTTQKINNSQINFNEYINNMDSDFFARIKTKYPTLTETEQQICSLLRYRLSTKEISAKLHKSSETIKWYRKRIRKKVAIGEQANLSDFCLNM